MQLLKLVQAIALATPFMLAGCAGDDGKNGKDGAQGETGQNGTNGSTGSAGTAGLVSLIKQTELPELSAKCYAGGLQVDSGVDLNSDGALDADEITATSYLCNANKEMNFVRIATFPVCQQISASCDTDTQTVAEIVDYSKDGLTLIYTDSPMEQIGFVDIKDPANPVAAGTLDVGGEPTSVAVVGNYALVGVNTSTDFVTPSGSLTVVDIATQTIVATIDMGGQPDSVAVSHDGMYAAVAIENERDEDLDDGQIDVSPQLPAGFLMVVDTSDSDPANWTATQVDMTGLADIAPTDPEPEYVDINDNNIAVVSMQENNDLVLVDLATASVINHFSAGTVDLDGVDLTEEDPAIISQTESKLDVPREPDGVTWVNNELFVTADEGDMNGGSRTFTVFNTSGDVVESLMMDQVVAMIGQYPDGRSGNKGAELENAEYGKFGDNGFLFVNSERASLVFVFDMADPANPELFQVLPAAMGPEGVKAIPSRNLLVAASEEDDRGGKFRGSLNIYRLAQQEDAYPTIISEERADGSPIPFSALSGLSADPSNADMLWSLEDSFYGQNRVFGIDISTKPAMLTTEIKLLDSNDIFAAVSTSGAAIDANSFDDADLAAMINDDKSLNIDGEGIAVMTDGSFWIASEGAGTFNDDARDITKLNFLFHADSAGVISDVVTLPDTLNAVQLRFGFEGVAEYDGKLYVAFQRAWNSEANPRIGIYDLTTQNWSFVFYPLDAVESQNGGWVGLSDITSLGDGRFLVLERDNQGGPDAAIKRLYKIDMTNISSETTISKTLVRDLMDDLKAAGGLVPEKIEGSAMTASGDVYIVNDNDGVDDNSGEIQLINLGQLN